jgi:NADH-quinone oxidoreductase subunit N
MNSSIANNLTLDLILVTPELVLLGATSAVLLLSLFAGRASEAIAYWMGLAALLGTFAVVYFAPQQSTLFAFNGMYVDDALAKAIKLFITATVAVVFIYSRPYLMQRELAKAEFYILGLFATLGMFVMASAHNFLLVYLGLELLSLCLYTLVAYARDSKDASEAAIKYFVLGAIASGMLLYGISILYGISGTLDLAELNLYLQNLDGIEIPLIFALIFVVVGVAFKLGAVPFHMWVPDVYHGAPTAITLFIATAPKLAAFVMAMRVLSDGLQELLMDWQDMLIVLAVLSLIFGNIIAIAQSNIKRMLAYSTISHIGFVLLGLLSGLDFGYAAALFYMVIYVLMAAGSFGVLLIVSSKNKEVDTLADLKGLSKSNPWFALLLLLLMFSMAGVPLTVGFHAKLYILQSLIYNGMLWLAILAIVMAIIGAFYYLRVVKYMYFDEVEEKLYVQHSMLAQAVLSVNGLLIVGLFIFPNPLLNYCIQVFG